MLSREAATERAFTGKYNEFDELGDIIVPFVEIICSVLLQNFQAAVAGQVSLKLIKKAYIIKEIRLMEWKE
jgi:hypothetical protein